MWIKYLYIHFIFIYIYAYNLVATGYLYTLVIYTRCVKYKKSSVKFFSFSLSVFIIIELGYIYK